MLMRVCMSREFQKSGIFVCFNFHILATQRDIMIFVSIESLDLYIFI